MTRGEKAAETARIHKERREAKKQLAKIERETVTAAMLSILSDEHATCAERIEAARILESYKDYR